MSNKDHLDDLSLDADMSEGIKGGIVVKGPGSLPPAPKPYTSTSTTGTVPAPAPAPTAPKTS